MKKYLYFALAFMVVLMPKLAEASASIYGPTGLIQMPTAEALQYKQFSIAGDYLLNSSSTSSNKDQFFYKVNLGTFKGWEVGVVGGTVPTEGVFVNAKYFLMSDSQRFPLSLALGFTDLGSASNSGVYLVASQRFQGGFNGHFGFRANFKPKGLSSNVMAGGEYFWSDNFSILAETVGDDGKYPINAGVRFFLNSDFQLHAGVLDVGNVKNNGTYVVLGLDYARFL